MTGKVTIVTGAARGIGLATAKLFLGEGHRVAMVDRDAEALRAAAAPLSDVHPLADDLSVAAQVAAMVRETEARFGRIDNLIDCAGVGLPALRK